MADAAGQFANGRRQIQPLARHMVEVELGEQIRMRNSIQQAEQILGGVDQKARHIQRVDGFAVHPDAQQLERLGGGAQVGGQGGQGVLAGYPGGQATGQHIDRLRAGHGRIAQRLLQRLIEVGLACRHAGQAVAALHQVAGRQVDQHQRQGQALQLLLQAHGWQLVGKLDLHALETGGAGGARPLAQRTLGEQQRQVGGESHAWVSRYCSTRVAGSCSA